MPMKFMTAWPATVAAAAPHLKVSPEKSPTRSKSCRRRARRQRPSRSGRY